MTVLSPAGGASKPYQINSSVRFRSSASSYLSRTPASAGSQTTWTFSTWVKQGILGSTQALLGIGNATNRHVLWFSPNVLELISTQSSVTNGDFYTTNKLADPTAWYHIVAVWDTTNATSTDRIRIYINGTRAAGTMATVPGSGAIGSINSAGAHNICRDTNTASWYFDGYMAETHFIDGQALDPSNFGQIDPKNPKNWIPKKYNGTYGGNGYYLKFNDGTSLTNLFLDRSGNGNNWTSSGVSLTGGTGGVSYDFMSDTPTNNYATINPLNWLQLTANQFTCTEANLSVSHSGTNTGGSIFSTHTTGSGKYYMEVTIVTPGRTAIGLADPLMQGYTNGNPISHPRAVVWGGGAGAINYVQNGGASFGADTYTTNDVVMIAYEDSSGKIWFGKNGTWNNSGNPSAGTGYIATMTSPGTPVAFIFGNMSSGLASAVKVNFGSRPYTYTPPTGFSSMCTSNLPATTIPRPDKHFDVLTYAANSTWPRSIVGLNFTPDLVWFKSRSTAYSHVIYDSVRGTGSTKMLSTDQSTAEPAFPVNANLQSFDSGGVTLAIPSSTDITNNTLAGNMVLSSWKGGGAAVSNTAGSITSQVSANPTAGFSIVTYTGTGANATVGHGLNSPPKLVIIKSRTGAYNWPVYHASLSSAAYWIVLNTTVAQSNVGNVWNSTAPTSTVFSIGTDIWPNTNGYAHVAYCFAEVPGYSKFGYYIGNGSADGAFVHCGFRPRYIMIKGASLISDWILHDATRPGATGNDATKSGYNGTDALFANLNNAEAIGAYIDITATGFKIRTTLGNYNTSTATYIFAAFAESPFGGSNVSPACAR